MNKTVNQENPAIKASRLDVFVHQLSPRLPEEIEDLLNIVIFIDTSRISRFPLASL